MSGKYTLTTLNCKGLRDTTKRRSILQFLKTKQISIILLQETHIVEEDLKLLQQEWEIGSICLNAGTTASAGQLVLTSKHMKIVENISHEQGRLQEVILRDQEFILRIFNIYGYNTDRLRAMLLGKLFRVFATVKKSDFVCIGGDFNVVMSNMLDKDGGNNKKTQSQVLLNLKMTQHNLIDTWRKDNPTQRSYTWAQRNPAVRCRLDYFLVPSTLSQYVKRTRICPSIKTDHKCVDLHVIIDKYDRGPGLWKLNNEILQVQEYINITTKLIERVWVEHQEVDLATRYDYLKYEKRKHTKQFCKKRSQLRKLKEREILIRIEQLEQKQQSTPLSQQEETTLEEQKQELEIILESKAKGAWIRSRIRYSELNEKSNSFFHSLAKEQHIKHTIRKLNINSACITDTKEVQSGLQNFYKQLYSSKYKNQQEYNNVRDKKVFESLSTLTEQEKDDLESEITLHDLTKSLRDFESNKTPGCDGLTKEFYVTFWTVLGPKILETLRYCKERKLLTQTQRRGVITLLHKQGKDKTKIENYRPLSLLNVDYKILTKTISNKIEKSLNGLIHSDQIGFLKGRYIGEGVRKIEDIIQYYEDRRKEGYILQLDFQKAFDSIEWPYLFETLAKFNFEENIIQWIKLCYTNIESAILNGGYTTNWFSLEKGLRQGCPLSAYLFLLCVEPLANKIRRNRNIQGLQTGSTEHKLSLFADDCTCLAANKESLDELVSELEIFTNYSGLQLNYDKCLLYPLRGTATEGTKFTVEENNFKLLGITLGRNKEVNNTRNIDVKHTHMDYTLTRWSQRQLSLIGKILITKSHAMSKMVHTMSIVDVHQDKIKETQQKINRFVWSGKPPKVKQSVLICKYDEGGLNALEVTSQYKALKMPWIWRMIVSNNWSSTINHMLQSVGGSNFLIHCNYDKQTVAYLPTFYREIFIFWLEIHSPMYSSELIIWNNKNIKIAGKSLYIKNLVEQNIIFIQDLMTQEHNFLDYPEFKARKNDVISCRDYKALIRAIKRYIARDRRISEQIQEDKPQIDFSCTRHRMITGKYIDISQAKSRDYYREFLELKTGFASALIKWTDNYHIDEEVFYNSLPRTKRSTGNTQLIAFQFKIMHNIINNRDNLYKWKISDSNVCQKCNENAKEDIIHEFVNCKWSKEVIRLIGKELNLINTFKNITHTNLIFGESDCTINCILLLVKLVIHKCRQDSKPFHINFFKNELYKHIISDKRTLKPCLFTNKWAKFRDLVDKSQQFFDSLHT